MYVYKELYHTRRTVRVHARQINELSQGEQYQFTVADHDAEDRATLLEVGIGTTPARKEISPGIQATQERLVVQGDDKPRLFVLRDSLVERDLDRDEAKRPCSIVEEFDAYSWPKGQDGRAIKEVPEKEHDHAMDALRYAVMAVDRGLDIVLSPRELEDRQRTQEREELAQLQALDAQDQGDWMNDRWWN